MIGPIGIVTNRLLTDSASGRSPQNIVITIIHRDFTQTATKLHASATQRARERNHRQRYVANHADECPQCQIGLFGVPCTFPALRMKMDHVDLRTITKRDGGSGRSIGWSVVHSWAITQRRSGRQRRLLGGPLSARKRAFQPQSRMSAKCQNRTLFVSKHSGLNPARAFELPFAVVNR